MSLIYGHGSLTVDLHNAKNVAGKRSQDTYAQVFLIEKWEEKWNLNQRVLFPDGGNERTNVHKKNISPVFDKSVNERRFTFTGADVTTKFLVISIWDKDSSSKDDFMARITIPLR